MQATTGSQLVEVQIVAAFTRGGAGGNLAGVVLDAAHLSGAERQRVAAEVALSETAFVVPQGAGTFEVAFYTPNKQVPDCGHATVATFGLLAQRGAIDAGAAVKRLVTGDEREIRIEDGRVVMEQLRAVVRPFAGAAQVAAALGLSADEIAGLPLVADNGVRFVIVATSHAALARIVPDQTALAELTEPDDAIGFYVHAPGNSPYDATIRMFAPRYGIPEESATGMAAGLLGAVLAGEAQTAAYRFEQGALSPRPSPSDLTVRVERDRVRVGGSATVVRTQAVDLRRG